MSSDFQTPVEIAKYMCSMIPDHAETILEPTPGDGNIVNELSAYKVTAPENIFPMLGLHAMCPYYDCVVMNPPFSSKYAHSLPDHFEINGMRLGYYILTECMKMTTHVIALMPWFTISDSDVRLRYLKNYGLKSITALPRKTFQYARIQTCVLELDRSWKGDAKFIVYDSL
jgi:hypothetical protein